jgi:hypothetical protein
MWVRWLALPVALGAGWSAAAGERPAGDLAPPVKLMAGGKPIDVDVGHAAPFVADFAGDGVRHLLVGQFGGGKLRIYRNAGTAAEPRFDAFTWFRAGGAEGSVPAS